MSPDTDDQQARPGRPFRDLSDSGLLWLINRVVFHPRGYALTITIDHAGHATGWVLQGTGREVWTFPTDVDEAKFTTAEDTLSAAARPEA